MTSPVAPLSLLLLTISRALLRVLARVLLHRDFPAFPGHLGLVDEVVGQEPVASMFTLWLNSADYSKSPSSGLSWSLAASRLSRKCIFPAARV